MAEHEPDLTCSHCGQTGPGIVLYPKLRNGGWIKQAECEDIGACLARRLRKTAPGDVEPEVAR